MTNDYERISKHIYRQFRKYKIMQNNKVGTYRNLQDAREERDYLESIDWDYSNME